MAVKDPGRLWDAGVDDIAGLTPPPEAAARPAHLKPPNRLEQIAALRERVAHLEAYRGRGPQGKRLHELRCLRAALVGLGDRKRGRRRRWDPAGWTHLGDGVYAGDYAERDIWLTDQWVGCCMVGLTPETLAALVEYAERRAVRTRA